MPPEWYFGRGVVLNMTHKKERRDRLRPGRKKTRWPLWIIPLSYGDIVCIRYDTDKTFGTAAYWGEHPGLSAEAVRFILDSRASKLSASTPPASMFPLPRQRQNLPIPRQIHPLGGTLPASITTSPTSKAGQPGQGPRKGFYISCFPVNLYQGSASWSGCGLRSGKILNLRATVCGGSYRSPREIRGGTIMKKDLQTALGFPDGSGHGSSLLQRAPAAPTSPLPPELRFDFSGGATLDFPNRTSPSSFPLPPAAPPICWPAP